MEALGTSVVLTEPLFQLVKAWGVDGNCDNCPFAGVECHNAGWLDEKECATAVLNILIGKETL